MSHPEQLGFLGIIARNFNEIIEGGSVLEIGAFDVNGSVRALFAHAGAYTGVDLTEGPGVDLVAYGHEVPFADDTFDVTVSAECLEHDPRWPLTFAKMVKVTRPGGVVAMTCASRGRPEHGTSRTLVSDSPGTQEQGMDYYRNLEESQFREQFDLSALFSAYRFYYLQSHFDLYFVGVKRGAEGCDPGADPRLPGEDEVKKLGRLMSLPHRLARLPLYILCRILPERLYQDFAAPYWYWLDRLFSGRFRRAGKVASGG